MLTAQQINTLADGIVAKWGDTAALHGAVPPPFESHATGDMAAGQALYRAACLGCHAAVAGSVLDPTYLALISDGGLRSLLVAGKPAQGMPDWRGYPGGPLSDQQLADLVSFLINHRTTAPGQPYANAQGAPSSAAPAQAAHQQAEREAVAAGPATGGPKTSHDRVPTSTSKHPTRPQP